MILYPNFVHIYFFKIFNEKLGLNTLLTSQFQIYLMPTLLSNSITCFQGLHVKCGIHVLVYYFKFYIFTHNSQLYALIFKKHCALIIHHIYYASMFFIT